MADYQAFKNRWTSRRVDADGVYGAQCVDLIIQYAREELHTGASMYGNAIDFWTRTPQGLVDTCDKIQTTDCQTGDIVVLRTAGHNDFAGDGHVGIADHQDGSNVWLLEQNASGTGTGTGVDSVGVHRAISKSRIAGVLRPRPVTPPPPVAPLFTVEAIGMKQIKVKQGARKWNLAHGTFNDVAANPITSADDNTIFTAVAVLHHREIPQYNYYLEDANTPHGWNVLDCFDYTAPPPPPPVITPPSAPIEIPKAERYSLVTTVMAFDTSDGAVWHNGTAKPFGPGEYYVIAKKDKAYNLSSDNMKDQNTWINIADNVEPAPLPPKVEVVPLPPRVVEVIENAAKDIPVAVPAAPVIPDWQKSRSFFNTDGSPEYFYSINTTVMDIPDLSTSQNAPAPLKPLSRHIPIVATYEKEGLLYGLPQNSYERGNLYLIPLRVLKLERKSFTEVIEEALNDLRIADRFNQTKYRVSKFIDGLKDTRAGKK